MSMQLFIHLANVLFLLAYLVRDIFALRLLSVVGSLSLYPYYVYGAAEPLYVPIAWNSVFVLINIVQLYRLFMSRRPVSLSAAERMVYEAVFGPLSEREFAQVLAAAERRTAQDGSCLIQEGERGPELLLLGEGEASVRVGTSEVARIGVHRFVGEMSYLSEQPASASVWAEGALEYFAWPCSALRELLAGAPALQAKVQQILGSELAEKVRCQHAEQARSTSA
jgi:CRP-like cAMP-binding protein